MKPKTANRKAPTAAGKPRTGNGKSLWLLGRLLGVLLGCFFFYAGFQKYVHAYEFAEAVLAYKLAPIWIVGAVAAVIPWVELISGFFLALGLKRRPCLLLITALSAFFLVLMAVTMARGLKIGCGCGLFFEKQVGWLALLENMVLLAWAAGLYRWEAKAGGSRR